MMNISILVVLGLQTFLAFIAAGFGWTWMADNQCDQAHASECDGTVTPYLPPSPPGGVHFFEYIVKVATWILMMTNMVPISLMVSLETVKYAQSFLME